MDNSISIPSEVKISAVADAIQKTKEYSAALEHFLDSRLSN
jgi:hypothetical protein